MVVVMLSMCHREASGGLAPNLWAKTAMKGPHGVLHMLLPAVQCGG